MLYGLVLSHSASFWLIQPRFDANTEKTLVALIGKEVGNVGSFCRVDFKKRYYAGEAKIRQSSYLHKMKFAADHAADHRR